MPTLEQILSEMYGQTAPLRTATVGNLQSILAGAPASSLPAYAPNRAAIEGQYNVAAEQARSLLPRGGQLNRAMLDLGEGRANAVSNLESAIRGDALKQASQLGFGMTPSFLSGAGAQQNALLDWNRQQQLQRAYDQQQLNAMLGNIGAGIPLLFGTPAAGQATPGLIQAILGILG